MPKNETAKSLGVEFEVKGLASTPEELNTMAQDENASIDMANQYYIAHNHMGKVRAAICKKAEELTEIPREKDADGKFTETEAQYLAKVEKELGEESLEDDPYASALREAAESVPVDYTKTPRGSGGGTSKVAQKWIDKARKLREDGQLELFAEKHGVELSDDEEETERRVGAKVKELISAQLRAAEKNLVG